MVQHISKSWLVASRFGTLHEYPLLAEGVAGASDALEVLHAHPLQRQDEMVRSRCSVQPPATRLTCRGITPQLTWCGLEAQGCA
jgi:hypothetical protein